MNRLNLELLTLFIAYGAAGRIVACEWYPLGNNGLAR